MRALSLEYHDVIAGGDFDESGFAGPGPNSYKLTAVSFAEHLAAIADVLAHAPARATDWLDSPSARRPLFLTFDDGGLGAYACTTEALERYGWRGHFFVTTGRIDTPGFLSRSQIRELHARGHVVGAHSYSHPTRMGACSPARIFDEWQRSMGDLADILTAPVVTGSVPGGFYTRDVGEAAARAGLKLLFTSWPTTRCWSIGQCRMLGRYSLRRWTSAPAAAALAAGAVLPCASQWAVYRASHLARTIGGDGYTRVRQLYWSRHG